MFVVFYPGPPHIIIILVLLWKNSHTYSHKRQVFANNLFCFSTWHKVLLLCSLTFLFDLMCIVFTGKEKQYRTNQYCQHLNIVTLFLTLTQCVQGRKEVKKHPPIACKWPPFGCHTPRVAIPLCYCLLFWAWNHCMNNSELA